MKHKIAELSMYIGYVGVAAIDNVLQFTKVCRKPLFLMFRCNVPFSLFSDILSCHV
jgi:hypothetical protein